MSLITISLCMIVKNEEAVLARVLESVTGIVDEIIITDTGSTDRTVEIAKAFGARVEPFKWVDDFAAARNYSFSKAASDYIMWLDADDYLKPKDIAIIQQLKRTIDPSICRVTMPYVLSRNAQGEVLTSLRRNRIVRRDCGFEWIGAVHEYLNAYGTYLDSEAEVQHDKDKAYTDRNLRIYRSRQEKGEAFNIRDLYYFANELKDHGVYDEAAAHYETMLRTGEGWVEDNIQACLKLSTCYESLGQPELRVQTALRALTYDKPRPEICCSIGNALFDAGSYSTAAYWYELATTIEAPSTMGMSDRAASTWYPHLQLCLCYDRLGQHVKAHEHNEEALKLFPGHSSMLHNRKYFQDAHGLEPLH
ncbi:glycosyltransferase [Paenibacillus pasadenensis]|uniref:glycosyltransferase n=1 Tax=Paenibacillus pasadenensis TaxID=217090 RepID=UPI00203E8E52|nr:glycosyltransferase [Paenibacillus pasadenensis]MCM3747243.1 glycosyltransferase [Paenibacillus pasadenensis]